MISIIAAIDQDNSIGYKQDLPWAGMVPSELMYFKKTTMNSTVIMGRKTFQSLPKKLTGRNVVVISSSELDGVDTVSPEQALTLAAASENVFIAGGAEVYELFLPVAGMLYLTIIQATFEADTYFPEIDFSEWKEISCHELPASKEDKFAQRRVVYERI